MSLVQEINVRTDRVFARKGLPRTMALAHQLRQALLPELLSIHSTWPFEDRVVIWLVPHLVVEAGAFHANAGPELAEIFLRHQLEHFDEVLSDELRARLDRAPA